MNLSSLIKRVQSLYEKDDLMENKKELLSILLEKFIEKTPHFKSGLIFNNQMDELCSYIKSNEDSNNISDIIPVVSEILKNQSIKGKIQNSSQHFGTAMFETKGYRIILNDAGKQAFLVVICDGDISINHVLTYNYLIADRISNIIENSLINKLESEYSFFDISSLLPHNDLVEHFIDLGSLNISGNESMLKTLDLNSLESLQKIVILGDPAVGKTSLVEKYTYGKFREDYLPTLGISITKQEYPIIGLTDSKVTMLLWDIAGQREFNFARKVYLEGSQAAFIVYSVTDELSFKHLEKWKDAVIEDVGNIPMVILANKIDLEEERVINSNKGKKRAKKMKCSYIETSAKTGENVRDAFHILSMGLFLK